MVTSVTSSTFLSNYHDDYRESDGFHRILFNPGRGVQARELTQLQTILSQEIKKLSNYFFNNGAIVSKNGGSVATRAIGLKYVVLNPSSMTTNAWKGLKNQVITQTSTGIKARVKYALTPTEAQALTKVVGSPSGANDYVLLVEYIDGGSSGGQEFTLGVSDIGNGTSPTENMPAAYVGDGSAFEMPDLDMYVNGFYVKSSAQGIVLDPFSKSPTEIVSFKVVEDVVTATDDSRLYENSGATVNITSPGADRYRIRLELIRGTDKVLTDTHVDVLSITNGIVSAIVTPDNQLALMGDILAARSRDTNGDFITRDAAGTFACHILNDSNDSDYFVVKVSPGTAFVRGYRIEKTADEDTFLRIEKPRFYNNTVFDDVDVVTNEKIRASLGNYFLIDSCQGGLIAKIGASNPKIYIMDSASDQIGSAAILAMSKFYSNDIEEFNYRVHVGLLDLRDSNGLLLGQLRGLNDARYLSADGTTIHAPILPVEGSYGLQAKSNSSLIYRLPTSRPYSLTNITATVGVTNTSKATGAGTTISISSGGDVLVDENDWIVVNTTDGTTVEGFGVTYGSGNTSATITGLTTGKSYDVYFYAERSLSQSSKTLVQNDDYTAAKATAYFDWKGQKFYVMPSNYEVIKINSITDDTTSKDITDHFALSNDDTETSYQGSRLLLLPGKPVPAGDITVNHNRFTLDTSDEYIYTGPAYGIKYKNIPSFRTRLGETIPLEDALDFRPIGRKTAYNTGAFVDYSFTGQPGVPKNNSLINIATAEYYMPRVDIIFLRSDGVIDYKKGDPSKNPKPKNVDPGSMLLATLGVNAFTKDKTDVSMARANNTGYKMSNIRNLERRIANLEEVTTLTMAELATKELRVADPETGIERDKIGLTVDRFKLNTQTQIAGIEHRARIDKLNGIITPTTFTNKIRFSFNSSASSNVTQYGNVVWPNFTEVEDSSLSQFTVSGPINVNSFSLVKFVGSGEIDPSEDHWSRALVVTQIEGDGEAARIIAQGNQLENVDPYWKRLGYSSYNAFYQDRF